jgi:hypothetical protein
MNLLLIMATFAVYVQATIGTILIKRIDAIHISSSWREVNDTCTIKLPLLRGKIDKKNAQRTLADSFLSGDRVEVKMAYQGIYSKYQYTEFKGFVRRVKPNVPLELECEDATYLFRRTNVQKVWKTRVTLKEILTYVVAQVNAQFPKYPITIADGVPNQDFPTFSIAKDNSYTNAADVLNFLKENYKLAVYFDDLTLHVRMSYTSLNSGKTVNYNLGGNIIKSNLTFLKDEDRRIQINAVGINRANKEIKYDYPESSLADMERRPAVFFNVDNLATLKMLTQAQYKKYGYLGYEGYINTFLIPFARHSLVANIKDPYYEDRTGKYLIDRVETDYGANSGIRRKVTLGIRLG